MKEEDQRIAIARECGTLGSWYCPKCRETVAVDCVTSLGRHNLVYGGCDTELHHDSPNYLHDLNSMTHVTSEGNDE